MTRTPPIASEQFYEISAGRLWWSQIRWAVDQIKFHGWKIEMTESPGFLVRLFTFKGEPAAIKLIGKMADNLAEQSK
jgi:hypothetical protein